MDNYTYPNVRYELIFHNQLKLLIFHSRTYISYNVKIINIITNLLFEKIKKNVFSWCEFIFQDTVNSMKIKCNSELWNKQQEKQRGKCLGILKLGDKTIINSEYISI